MRKLGFFVAAVVLALGAYWVVKGANSGQQPARTIRVGYLNIMAGIPLLAAQHGGMFEKAGLKVELVEFKTGNEVATAAVSGEIDVIGGAATNAVLDAAATSKKNFKIFLANEYTVPVDGRPSTDLLISRKGIAGIGDLAGKTVGIYPGSVGRVFASVVFPKLGLALDQFKLVEIPATQMLTALKSGAVDAVTALEPQATIILSSGDFNVLVDGYYGQVMPRVPASGSWFVPDRLSRSEEVAFAEVLFQAASLVQGDRSIAEKLLVERQSVPADLAKKTRLLLWSPVVDQAARRRLEEYLAFMKANGLTSFNGGEWIWRPVE